MANASEREARDLEQLNLALDVLRGLADKEGYVPGSPVELIFAALTESGKEISLSRVRSLVTKLGELGWREEAWIGSKNVRGSKIVMHLRKIKNLETLPAKVERERFEKEVATWFSRNHDEVIATWVITNPHKGKETATIAIVNYGIVKPRGQRQHWTFRLSETKSLPEWLKNMLTPGGTLADSTLYTLCKSGHARQA